MKADFLSWLLNVVKIHYKISMYGILLLEVKTNRYDVAEHITTKVEVNTQIFSKLKIENISQE